MKKSFICIILCIIFIFTVSCTSLDNNSTSNEISMKTGIVNEEFSMSVPEDYEETSSKYISQYFIKNSSATIIVTNEANSYGYDSIEKYYENAVQQYITTFDTFNEISTENITVSSLYNAKIVEFSYQIFSENNVIDMTCYVEYILLGNTIYIITCSAPTDAYEDYKNDFVQTVKSVSINR